MKRIIKANGIKCETCKYSLLIDTINNILFCQNKYCPERHKQIRPKSMR